MPLRTSPAGPPTYARYFGLREAPFSHVPDRRFVFLGACHTKALAHLLHGVQQQDSILHLTGDMGSGKTTVCRLLLDRLPHDVDAALIPDPALLCDALDRHLRAGHSHKRRTVVIVDDAHRLGVGALEQLRLLTRLPGQAQELLRLILIGRSELIELLGLEVLPRLSRPVTAGYHLLPFAEAETSAYVRHRLTLAGGARDIFESDALPQVHRLSGGTPRLINTICDRALLDAHARGRRTVDEATVRGAARQTYPEAVAAAPSHPVRAQDTRPPWPWLVSGGLVASALVVGTLILTRPAGFPLVAPPAAVEKAKTPGPALGVATEQPVAPARSPVGEPPPAAQLEAGESPFRIDILVWAPDPNDRMVYVNGHKYIEGEALESGAVIEQIVQDGVVLVHHDQRTLIRSEARQAAPAEEAPR